MAGNITPFDDVSLKGPETDSVATIRFHVAEKDLRKKKDHATHLIGTTLTVSAIFDEITYKAEIKGLEIKAVDKDKHVKFEKHNMDVTVTKTSPFSVKERI